MGKYESLGTRVGKLVDTKNAAYGNSFNEAGDFLKILYPNGILPEQYNDMLCLVRVFDKMKRIATDKDALGESPYQDITGYGLLGLERVEAEKADRIALMAPPSFEQDFQSEKVAELPSLSNDNSGPATTPTAKKTPPLTGNNLDRILKRQG